MGTINLKHGDNLEILKTFEDNSVDSVVTDPPYGLKFMGKKWDHNVPSIELWKEVLRVLKPGGHLLSFGGTRTYHRMVVNIEDAGFEIRDQIMWLYGSGFPKSHNISKGIDKKFGAERDKILKPIAYPDSDCWGIPNNNSDGSYDSTSFNTKVEKVNKGGGMREHTLPSTDLAKQWDGFGTNLKPANEPIVMARKPLSEKTIVANILKWGTGGINIDGCRVEFQKGESTKSINKGATIVGGIFGSGNKVIESDAQGRFPANLILDEQAGALLDEQSGACRSSGNYPAKNPETCKRGYEGGFDTQGPLYSDKGGASRFFYCAKVGKKERGTGNNHPTMKPIKLMSYLVRLVTPPNGTVLDPFMGSGSTGIAAKSEGFNFIGIELEAEYIEIARRRIGE